jgi:hypothetical protein
MWKSLSRRRKFEEITADRSVFEHLRAQFLLADHRVSQERILLQDRSFRYRQLFTQCVKLGLKRRDVTERLTESLLMRHLEKGCVVSLFDALLERFRLIKKLNCCAHLFKFLLITSVLFLFLFIFDWVTLSSLDWGTPAISELA